ncbi:MAG TPA: helix-turn-helix domain-containing protein [Gemmatimonadales bacterium]|nr:helix-turn-helix domain-containing protein [Gemmatimonadales bacterium]
MEPLPLLVVTMDARHREQLSSTLAAAGHHVVTAGSGADAAEALGVPGLGGVVVDLALPGLDRAALRRSLTPATPVPPGSLEDAERRHIALTLNHTKGNKRQAALLLGISRSTLLHKIRRYDLAAVAVRGRPAR